MQTALNGESLCSPITANTPSGIRRATSALECVNAQNAHTHGLTSLHIVRGKAAPSGTLTLAYSRFSFLDLVCEEIVQVHKRWVFFLYSRSPGMLVFTTVVKAMCL